MKGKKSKYDDHFEIGSGKATCRKCGKIIILSLRNTYGMKYHAEKVHDVNFDEEPKAKISKPTSTLDSFVQIKKPSMEELVSQEAAQGVSFRYLAKSPLIRKGLAAHGYQDKAPKSHVTVQRCVKKSAVKHRQTVREKIKQHLKKGQRFCAITDEWTCPTKKRKYLNVTLHLKGKFVFYYLPYSV